MRLAELVACASLRRLFRRSDRRKGNQSSRRPVFESLEARMLLSVDPIGIPAWIEEGPGPTLNGQTTVFGLGEVSGAIEAIAPHPDNPDILYVGTVNGGVWRTTNATATPTPDIVWTPLTDQFPSLSIGDIAFSPLDSNTLFAGIGRFSSASADGGPLTGLLRTTDGGDTWIQLTALSGRSVRSVVPTAIGTSLADQVVLVGTNTGVFRSTNGGDTYAPVSVPGSGLPAGPASHLVGDPGNSTRFYAAIQGQGVFRSDDAGQNWFPMNTGLSLNADGLDNDGDGVVDGPSESVGGAGRIELSVSEASGNPVYVALIGAAPNDQLMGVFRSADRGLTWTQIGTAPAIHPGKQGNVHFSILADQTDPNRVYVGGDRITSSPFTANLVVGDASTNTWARLPTIGSPHADSRDMVFDASGAILQADDGGIFRLPITGAGAWLWRSLNTNLRITEFYSVAYNPVTNTIIGGTQDNGIQRQLAPNSFQWAAWDRGGDGGTVAVDAAATSTSYVMGNNFSDFFRNGRQVLLASPSSPGRWLSGLNIADRIASAGSFVFVPYVLNAVDSSRILLGANGLYEDNQIPIIETPFGPIPHETGDVILDVTPAGYGGTVSLAYGGRLFGVDNPDVAYVGDNNGDVWLRTAAGGAFQRTNFDATLQSDVPLDIVLDPDDYGTAYLVDTDDVFATVDFGLTWTELTGDLGDLFPLSGNIDLRTIELVSTPAEEVLLVGGHGGAYWLSDPRSAATGGDAVWAEFGRGLPNAVVKDLRYDPTDDVLLAGTFGRGAWTVSNASVGLRSPGLLRIDGDADQFGLPVDDLITLRRNPDAPLLLDVFQNSSVPRLSLPFALVSQIEVDGGGGDDVLIVDFSNGDVIPAGGLGYEGGGSAFRGDQLLLEGGEFERVTYQPTGFGAGTVDLDDNHLNYSALGSIFSTSAMVTDTTTAFVRDFAETRPALTRTIRISDDGNPGNGLSTITTQETLVSQRISFSSPVGTFLVHGGPGNEIIELLPLDPRFGTPVNIHGQNGNDVVSIQGTRARVPTAVFGGEGNDLIQVGMGNLDAIQGSVFVSGGNGTDDRIVVDDASIAFSDTYTISSVRLDRPFFGGLEYHDVEALTLDAQNGANTIAITGTDARTSLTVNAGAGNDNFMVGQGDLDALPGAITVNGQGGTDQVSVDDSAALTSDSYLVTDRRVIRRGFQLAYGTVEGLTLHAQQGDNAVTVASTAFGAPVTVNTGPGDDSIRVGTGNLETLVAFVTVNGEGDTDQLVVDDGAALLSSTVTYRLEANDLTRSASGRRSVRVAYDTLEGLTLNAHPGENVIDVRGTAAGTSLTINGGAGHDQFSIRSGGLGAGTTNTFNGRSGNDAFFATPATDAAIHVDGGSHTLGDDLSIGADGLDLTIQANILTVDGRQPVTFSGLERIGVLNVAGVEVLGDANSNFLSVDGGFVDDAVLRLDLGPPIGVSDLTALSFRGEGGDDFLRINHPVGALFAPRDGVRYDGGGQPGDELRLDGGGGPGFVESYRVGPGPGDGTIEIKGEVPGDLGAVIPLSFTLQFTGLAPVIDTVAVGELTIIATGARNTIVVDNGRDVGDGLIRVTIDAFEPLEFASKQRVFVRGGGGRDLLTANFTEVPNGVEALTLDGEAGNDRLTVIAAAGVKVNLVGGAGRDVLIGSAADEGLDGGPGNDVLRGGAGNDRLFGGDGDDRLLGGGGNDELDGGAGDDMLRGQGGNDTLTGGPGSDTFDGGRGIDTYVDAGPGDIVATPPELVSSASLATSAAASEPALLGGLAPLKLTLSPIGAEGAVLARDALPQLPSPPSWLRLFLLSLGEEDENLGPNAKLRVALPSRWT